MKRRIITTPYEEMCLNIDKMATLLNYIDVNMKDLAREGEYSYMSIRSFFKKRPNYMSQHLYDYMFEYFKPLLEVYDQISDCIQNGDMKGIQELLTNLKTN